MNKEDLVGIVNYWCLQGEEAASDELRLLECRVRIAETLAEVAFIEINS